MKQDQLRRVFDVLYFWWLGFEFALPLPAEKWTRVIAKVIGPKYIETKYIATISNIFRIFLAHILDFGFSRGFHPIISWLKVVELHDAMKAA
jgi:hypothetical protein